MSEIVDNLVDGLLDRESDTGCTVSWAGQTVVCSGGGAREGKVLDIGGFKPNAQVVIVIRLSVLAPNMGRPTNKQSISFVSAPGAPAKALRVETATVLYNAILVLECNDPSAGS